MNHKQRPKELTENERIFLNTVRTRYEEYKRREDSTNMCRLFVDISIQLGEAEKFSQFSKRLIEEGEKAKHEVMFLSKI